MYEDTDCEPISLTTKDIETLLIDSGVPEDITSKIGQSYVNNFGEDLPLAEHLIDPKALKVMAQRKKEEQLEKKVEFLQARLEEIKQEAAVDKENTLASETETADNSSNVDNDLVTALPEEAIDSTVERKLETDAEANEGVEGVTEEVVSEMVEEIAHIDASNYDVILQVKPEKVPQIKSQIIDGQKCIVIPINENEQATLNGLDNFIGEN